jgi:hypothetical protein
MPDIIRASGMPDDWPAPAPPIPCPLAGGI